MTALVRTSRLPASLASCLTVLVCASLVGCGQDEASTAGLRFDDGAGEPAEPAVLTGTIGPEGGTISGGTGGPYAHFSLVVPPGALTESVDFTIRGIVDVTPIPAPGERIGPMFIIEPTGLEPEQAFRITVPVDPTLRAGWGTANEDLRALVRNEDTWDRVELADASDNSVTFEIIGSTVVAAGLVTAPRAVDCDSGCEPVARSGEACTDGEVCLELLGYEQQAPLGRFYSFADGRFWWLTAPLQNGIALSGFDVRQGEPVAQSGTALRAPSGSLMAQGQVVTVGGARWLGVRGMGNIRFEGDTSPTRFDTGGAMAAGVALDPATGAIVRLRSAYGQRDIEGAAGPESVDVATLSAVSEGFTYVLGSFEREHAALGVVTTSTDVEAETPFAAWAPSGGVHWFGLANTPNAVLGGDFTCGGAPLGRVLLVRTAPGGNDHVVLCTTADGARWLQGSSDVVPTVDVTDLRYDLGDFAVAPDGDIVAVSIAAPLIVLIGRDGAVTRIPLFEGDIRSPDYNAMVPRAVGYDAQTDAAYIVTRGTEGLGDIYRVTELP